jgi:hypothetical protein
MRIGNQVQILYFTVQPLRNRIITTIPFYTVIMEFTIPPIIYLKADEKLAII